MKNLTLEYIAGFVDGEGTFTIVKNNIDGYIPLFSVGNTNRQVLEDIRKFFSLAVNVNTHKPKNPTHKTAYLLPSMNIDDCKSIATALEPYLRIKKEQAQIIMKFPRSNPTLRGRHTLPDLSTRSLQQKLRKKIMLLNKTGKPVQEANEDLQPEPDPQLNLLDLNQKEVI